ncbi:MAG: ammonium transporter [Flammeovirgaceae bacterium]
MTTFTSLIDLSAFTSGALCVILDAANEASVNNAVAEAATQATSAMFTANNIWMMIATALVFIMHLGFASVEAGFTQAKNTVNILFKNTLTPVIGLLSYAFIGFSLMYPGADGFILKGFLGFSQMGLRLPENGLTGEYANLGYTYWTDFLFQGMFAATCATIVSGAVAERIKVSAYLIFTLFYVTLTYPIVGSWQWGGGFLKTLGGEAGGGFYDFAGSTLVHSVGGWAALIGAMLVGPRIGKYVEGKVVAKPASSVPLATIGVFLLWLGWFGFNGGSVLSANPAVVSLVLVTTSLAACAGALSSTIMTRFLTKKLDLGMTLNGILAGLVGITAGADQMGIVDSVLIGLISGVLVVVAVNFFDKFKVDDPVGAISVHLVCGVFGTLAVGIFGNMASWQQFVYQLIGVVVCGIASAASAFIIFKILDLIIGLRVSKEHEIEGLDSHEHGVRGYTITYDE